MRAVLRLWLGATCALGIGIAGASASAITVDVSTVLGNSGYELGNTSQWTATLPNATFVTPVPVNPAIAPLDPCCSNGTTLPLLLAPDGNYFVGVTNHDPDDVDEKGKLVHDAISVSYATGTDFQVTVWANRGRLGTNGNTTSTLPASPPTLSVNISGWTAGALPTVNPANDNWSRTRAFNVTTQFTNWGTNTEGQWRSQTFTFPYAGANPLAYLSIAITGSNNNHDQYIAWDIAPVPEPSTGLLLAFGLVGIAARRARRA